MRPDITFAVTKLAQYLSNSGYIHWTEAKRILRYLSNTPEYCLNYKAGQTKIEIWTDVDGAIDTDDRHLFSGYIVTMGKNN